MRVISGKFKKKKLLLPNSEITRPLRDYVKESLFNLLTHSKLINFELNNSVVLDIFSGAGSFGIECLSRGAQKVIFIEQNKNSIDILNKNIKNLSLNEQSNIICSDFFKVDLKTLLEENIKLVFLDPPFQAEFLNELFDKLKKFQKKLSNALIVMHYEKNNKFNFDVYLNIILKKEYGRSVIIFATIKN
jgi:16S rRNA (guanine966-N2)-methyltransferase